MSAECAGQRSSLDVLSAPTATLTCESTHCSLYAPRWQALDIFATESPPYPGVSMPSVFPFTDEEMGLHHWPLVNIASFYRLMENIRAPRKERTPSPHAPLGNNTCTQLPVQGYCDSIMRFLRSSKWWNCDSFE